MVEKPGEEICREVSGKSVVEKPGEEICREVLGKSVVEKCRGRVW